MNPLYESYEKYAEINFCSNKLIGGVQPITVEDGILPLEIYKGKKNRPLLWVRAITQDSDGKKNGLYIVEENKPKFNKIEVNSSKGRILIKFQGKDVIDIRQVGNNSVDVWMINLTAIGLNIVGDVGGLYIGSQVFKNNVVEGGAGSAFIALR